MIHRDIQDSIKPWLDRGKIVILKGARQVGKTTILKEFRRQLEGEGRAVRYIAADLDFADPSFGDPRLFLRRLDDLFGHGGGTVIIDEFQAIPDAGLFLKTIYDQAGDRFRFLVSGSSSLELTKTAEFLTGRKMEFIVRPFSFREFVRAKAADIPDRLIDRGDGAELADRAALYGVRLKALYSEYLRFGGYPEAVLAPTDIRIPLLKELLSTYVLKDVAGFQRVENIAGFNNLVRVLCSRIGSQVIRSELASTLRLNQETVSRYLDILEGTFVLNLVPPWFTNPRKEVSKMPKAYISDPAFALATGTGMAETLPYEFLDGHLVENAVYATLRGTFGTEQVKYWRTASGAEIDFIVAAGNELLPLEVKFTGAMPKEPVAMRNFKGAYAATRGGVVISKEHVAVGDSDKPTIIPAYLADYVRW